MGPIDPYQPEDQPADAKHVLWAMNQLAQMAPKPSLGTGLAGKYELLEELGRGATGTVFKAAEKTATGRLVAVKIFHSTSNLERARIEAQAAARLQHKNIVGIHHVDDDEGRLVLVLEYVDGGTLARRLQVQPALTADGAARYARDVALALQLAHEKGIIHRDLKPGNILLSSQDEPKIADFSLAKVQDATDHLTETGDILGTFSYMPPEQAAGTSRSVGPGADIYSLGAILYHMITGFAPFRTPEDRAGQVEIIQLIQTQPVVPPREKAAAVPKDLERICLKCLEKIPRDRYLSAKDLAEDLDRYLNGEPVQARPIPMLNRFGRWLVGGHMGREFLRWETVFFLLAAAIGLSHVGVFLVLFFEWPAPLGFLLHAGGIAALGFILLRQWSKFKAGFEKQMALTIFWNFVGCGVANWLVVGNPFGLTNPSMYPYWTLLNGVCFLCLSATPRKEFFAVFGLAFFALALVMPQVNIWSPLMYGLAWGISLVSFGLYFRRERISGRG